MESNVIVLPKEVEQLAQQVSVEKRNEVQTVLNQVFDGVSKMKEQLDLVNVEDPSDKNSMAMAKTIRLGVKEKRLDAEKSFDAKRDELRIKMLSDKTEDALWLKAKQVMQILTKEIEESAKWKETTKERHEAEQKEIRTQNRALVVAEYGEVGRSEFENMSDDSFKSFINGLKATKDAEIEEERKAEQDRIAREKAEQTQKERREKMFGLGLKWNGADFIFEDINFHWTDLVCMTDKEFDKAYSGAVKRKAEIEKEQQAELTRLRKENEVKQKALEKERQEAKALADKKEKELEKERAKAKAEAAKTEADAQAKLKLAKQAQEKAEAELQAKKDAEKKLEDAKKAEDLKARQEADRLAKAGDKAILLNWVNGFAIKGIGTENLNEKSIEKANDIFKKFEAFKKWAKNEIENN